MALPDVVKQGPQSPESTRTGTLVQTHWLIPYWTRRVMLDSMLFVANRLGRMDFSARTGAASPCREEGVKRPR